MISIEIPNSTKFGHFSDFSFWFETSAHENKHLWNPQITISNFVHRLQSRLEIRRHLVIFPIFRFDSKRDHMKTNTFECQGPQGHLIFRINQRTKNENFGHFSDFSFRSETSPHESMALRSKVSGDLGAIWFFDSNQNKKNENWPFLRFFVLIGNESL